MREEAMDQVGLLSQPAYGEMQFQVQLLQIHTRQISHFYMFQMMPSTLVPRTQIRSIARQYLYMRVQLRFAMILCGFAGNFANEAGITPLGW